MINVILFRGLAGEIYSTGLDVLAMKLKKLPNVDYVVVDSYTSWKQWVERIKNWKDPTVLIGHSYGATAALGTARSLPQRPFPMVVTFDPSQWWRMSASLWGSGGNTIASNAGRVINFYQQGWPIGGQTIKNAINLEINTKHIDIDDIPSLHDTVLEEVAKFQ